MTEGEKKGAPRWQVWVRRVIPVLLAAVVAFVAGKLTGAGGTASTGPAPPPAASAGKAIWTCAMHPQIQLPEAGKCPICGMDLIPLESGESTSPNQVQLSERAKTLARIRTVAVHRADTSVEMRLLGRLEHAETRVRTITPWTGGRIDRLYVSNVGARIGAGTVIALLYSPEIYAAHQDLISAKRQLDALADGLPLSREAAKTALGAARKRLGLLGIKDSEVSEMEGEEAPRRHVKVRSQYGGTVLEQLVNEGAYVTAGTPLYRTADLSSLWVQLDAYESDLSRIRLDQTVRLTVSSFPGETFEGKVAFIDPVVDPKNRTAQVRVEVPNKDGRLSPGMFAEAIIAAPTQTLDQGQLVIPNTAALFTGKRSVVYVEVPNEERPTYEPREVQLGPRAGDVYPVAGGLEEGERVVIAGAFALDSDLQIRGGPSMMSREDDAARRRRDAIAVPPEFMEGLAPVLKAYVTMHDRLRSDDNGGAKRAGATLAKEAKSFDPRSPDEARKIWQELSEEIFSAGIEASKSDDIERTRRAFARATEPVVTVLERFGNPLAEPVRLAFCPMVFGNQGAHWVQRPDEIENPYFGAAMYRCGEVKESIAPHHRLGGSESTGPSTSGDKGAPAASPAPKPGVDPYAGHRH